MNSFGFDDVVADFNKLTNNAENAKPEVRKMAVKMRDRAKAIATSNGLIETGAGVEGIDIEEKNDEVDVGWGQRPNFHLYFHEIGFHAIDNRRGKVRISRSGKNRTRVYTTNATYIAAKPHMRPAFDELEPEFYKKIQQTLERGV